MEKREVLDRLEEIADSMDSDFLNRQEIEAIVEDITQGIKIEVN